MSFPRFTLGSRHYPLQPVFRELNSHLFAFFKNHFSASGTNSSHVSNSGTVFNLAQSTVPYVSDTSQKNGHLRKLIKKLAIFILFKKNA